MVYDIICVKKYSLTRLSQICDDTKCMKKMLLALLHLSWLVYFLPITLLLQWRVRVYKKTFSVYIKIAQTMQNIWNSACEQRAWLFEILLSESLPKKWQTSGIIWEISYSNLETRRYSPKSGISRIIQESWQHW